VTENAGQTDRVIRFWLDGEVHTAAACRPTTTVLEYLRERLGRTGTKEGCAEGDCGACTVVLVDAPDGEPRFRPVNACIQFLPTLHGKGLLTVESLRRLNGGELHPVQQAMHEAHGSQCGFCTPGFVMSLFGLYKSRAGADRAAIDDALAGNLCRCTGYRPIITAAQEMYERAEHPGPAAANVFTLPGPRPDAPGSAALVEALAELRPACRLELEAEGVRFLAPVSADDLADCLGAHPEATVLAGGTDVGLWATKQLRDFETVIYLGNCADLQGMEEARGRLAIGAAVPLSEAAERIVALYPGLHEVFRRFASPPIRNAGTLCGNIANGSPIGDSMPALIALGAELVLRRAGERRQLPLEDFYLGYQQKDLRPGEFLESVQIPLPAAGSVVRSYKISKRFDQDISAVCGAYALRLEGERIAGARVAYGGLAAVPARARRCEAALAGRPLTPASIEAAAGALAEDFQPITDMRASASYRLQVAQNLLQRLYHEQAQPDVQAAIAFEWATP